MISNVFTLSQCNDSQPEGTSYPDPVSKFISYPVSHMGHLEPTFCHDCLTFHHYFWPVFASFVSNRHWEGDNIPKTLLSLQIGS